MSISKTEENAIFEKLYVTVAGAVLSRIDLKAGGGGDWYDQREAITLKILDLTEDLFAAIKHQRNSNKQITVT